MQRLAKHIYRFFKQRSKSYLENPVLVYQMGKVASSSICNSLKATPGFNAFHVHRLNPENIELVKQVHLARGVPPMDESSGLDLHERLIKPGLPARVISLFREPIGRNISAYFQNLTVLEKDVDAHKNPNTMEMIDNFMHNYNHDIPLNWFDIEIKTTLGIDVYEYTFPRELGYQTIASGPYELLLMRHDLADHLKAGLIRDFLGLDSFVIKRVNEGNTKEYASSYRKFLETIRIPRSYAQRMLQSRYARHFFTATELDKIERYWTRT